MGARLEGTELRRTNRWELFSEAVAPGTVQVAHDGQPIVLLGDCQTIGGYPKIAHVITVDLPRAAQLRPNDTVRFQKVTVAEATTLFAGARKGSATVPRRSFPARRMKLSVDLNADLGEGAATEAELLGLVTSANIACGFHAGSPTSMTASIRAAHAAGVAVGAHPSLADRENFGRHEQPVTPEEVFALVDLSGRRVSSNCHVARRYARITSSRTARFTTWQRGIAALGDAVAHALLAVDRTLILFAPGGSALAQAGGALGLRVAREVFADRNYQSDGALVPRTQPGALLSDAEEAAARIVRMLRENVVRTIDGSDLAIHADTICVHGDTPDAVAFARKLRAQLASAGITVAAPLT